MNPKSKKNQLLSSWTMYYRIQIWIDEYFIIKQHFEILILRTDMLREAVFYSWLFFSQSDSQIETDSSLQVAFNEEWIVQYYVTCWLHRQKCTKLKSLKL